jgi:flagellar hook-length control protein FliK
VITLGNFSQLAAGAEPAESLPAAHPDDGGVANLAAFDNTLSQTLVPHQQISLRPTVVMDLIASFETNATENGLEITASTDEQNQQLLALLLQLAPPPATTPPVGVPLIGGMPPVAHQPLEHPVESASESLRPAAGAAISLPLITLLKPPGPQPEMAAQVATVATASSEPRQLTEGLMSATTPSAAVPLVSMDAGRVIEPLTPASAARVNEQLTLAKNPQQWPQELRSALGERLQLQIESKIQHATIRLDPPDMGKIDISLHLEGGKLQVHINASQGDVYRALQQTSAELRQTLMAQNNNAVDVNISANSQQQQRQQQNQQSQHPHILAALHIENSMDTSTDDGTLLTTV